MHSPVLLAALGVALVSISCSPEKPSGTEPSGARQPVAGAPAAGPGGTLLSPEAGQLAARSGAPLFNLERVNRIVKGPKDVIEVPAGTDLVVEGWAVDQVMRARAGGVNVVVDGKTFPAFYGIPRADVSNQFQIPDYMKSGFSCSIPAERLSKGTHNLTVRIISNDGSGYYEGWAVTLNIR